MFHCRGLSAIVETEVGYTQRLRKQTTRREEVLGGSGALGSCSRCDQGACFFGVRPGGDASETGNERDDYGWHWCWCWGSGGGGVCCGGPRDGSSGVSSLTQKLELFYMPTEDRLGELEPTSTTVLSCSVSATSTAGWNTFRYLSPYFGPLLRQWDAFTVSC